MSVGGDEVTYRYQLGVTQKNPGGGPVTGPCIHHRRFSGDGDRGNQRRGHYSGRKSKQDQNRRLERLYRVAFIMSKYRMDLVIRNRKRNEDTSGGGEFETTQDRR